MRPAYEALALEDELAWKTVAEVVGAARGFLNPVLGSDVDAVWEPTSWEWRSRSARSLRPSDFARGILGSMKLTK